jgi:hypothetical protein
MVLGAEEFDATIDEAAEALNSILQSITSEEGE